MVEKLVIKYDKVIHRILEILPGLFTWGLLLSPIWLGLLVPQAIVYLLTLLTVYWVYLAVKHGIGMVLGYKKYKKEMATNWWKECQNLDFSNLPDKKTLPASLEDVRHMILIPVVDEPLSVLSDSLTSVAKQTLPTKQIVVVYTIEEKNAKGTLKNIKAIVEKNQDIFCKVLIYVHPAGIAGEAIGAGAANRTWGATHAVEDLKKSGENIRNYIFSTIDADHVLDPQYLARLTHLYLTSDKRDNKFYTTAVHLFDNNYWRVPMLMRIEATAVTLGTMSYWAVTRRETKDTFAAYSASLQTLIDANYWDVSLGVDDTMFYWRAFFARNGDFVGRAHFIPYSADAVEGSNLVAAHKSLYKQLLRWGWGVMDFPLSMKEFLKNKKIRITSKIAWLIEHIEKRVVLINIVFLITFGFALLTSVNPNVKQTNFAYSLPDIMSLILTTTLLFFIPTTIVRFKMVKPFPKNWPYWKKFLALLEAPLVVVNMLTFSFVPFVEAQTRMLLGKRMKDLYYTPKIR